MTRGRPQRVPAPIRTLASDRGVARPQGACVVEGEALFEPVPALYDRIVEMIEHRGAELSGLLSWGIIDARGGRIWAKSELGKGSRFCFCLPRVKGG